MVQRQLRERDIVDERVLAAMARVPRELFVPPELREDRRLVARAGADVQHALPPGQRERLADPRDHVRLRDRLPLADRERRVVVRAPAHPLRHEQLARDARHRGENALVGDAARAQLTFDHRFALSEHRRSRRRRSARALPA